MADTTDNRSTGTVIDFHGFKCRYRLQGHRTDQPPMFCISGAFQTMSSWSMLAARMSAHTQVLLADLPGSGQADLLPHRYGLDFLADAARAVMRAAGVRQADVVSASYGSTIAYRLAQVYPDSVHRLILAGVMREIPDDARGPTADTLVTLADGRMKEFARQVIDGLLCRDPSKTIEKQRLTVRILSHQLEHMSLPDRNRYRENTMRLLEHAPLDLSDPPRAPALVFTGEHDVYTKPKYCREIAQALPNAKFTTIERTDHLFHIERPDTTYSLTEAFFTSGHVEAIAGCGPIEVTRPALASAARIPDRLRELSPIPIAIEPVAI